MRGAYPPSGGAIPLRSGASESPPRTFPGRHPGVADAFLVGAAAAWAAVLAPLLPLVALRLEPLAGGDLLFVSQAPFWLALVLGGWLTSHRHRTTGLAVPLLIGAFLADPRLIGNGFLVGGRFGTSGSSAASTGEGVIPLLLLLLPVWPMVEALRQPASAADRLSLPCERPQSSISGGADQDGSLPSENSGGALVQASISGEARHAGPLSWRSAAQAGAQENVPGVSPPPPDWVVILAMLGSIHLLGLLPGLLGVWAAHRVGGHWPGCWRTPLGVGLGTAFWQSAPAVAWWGSPTMAVMTWAVGLTIVGLLPIEGQVVDERSSRTG